VVGTAGWCIACDNVRLVYKVGEKLKLDISKFKVKRIDKASTQDSVAVENAELAKTNLKLEPVDAATQEEVINAAKDTNVVLTRYADMNRHVIKRLPKLQAVIKYGIGYDNIDVDAATDNGVLAINVPDYCYEEVSNHTIGMLLMCARKLLLQNNVLKKEGWQAAYSLRPPMGSITGQTLGIIGCGNIGRMVARKAQCFGLHIIGYDPHVDPKLTKEAGIKLVSLEVVLRKSDYISCNPLLWRETFHIVSEKEFRMMKPTVYIVNTSRGPVIDQQALTKALQEKRIAGAALDVLEKEPIDENDPLLKMENVVLTPHTAYYSDASDKRLRMSVAQEAARIALGHLPRNYVNRNVKPKILLIPGD
jgi:D-3-phosphoglycerate dehydrogenase / 2-oxoglutarate reductase